MKLSITDMSGVEHDLEPIIMGLVNDISVLHQRLIFVENQLGIKHDVAEEVATTEPAE